MDGCCKYSCQNIDEVNAFSCLELGVKMNLPHLREGAIAYLGFKFDSLIKNNHSIGHLSFDAISLMAGQMKVEQPGSEDDVLDMIMRWSDANKSDSKQLELLTTQINFVELSEPGKCKFTEMEGTKGNKMSGSRMLPMLLVPVGERCNHYLGGCTKEDSKYLFGYEYRPGQKMTPVEDLMALPIEDGKPIIFRYFGRSQSVIVAATLHIGPCRCECYEHRRRRPCEIWK